jgi:hypothetical protein
MVRLPLPRDINLDLDKYINRFIPPSQLHRLPRPISRFLGHREASTGEIGDVLVCAWSFIGAFCGIILVAGVFRSSALIQSHHPPLIIASLVSYLLQQYYGLHRQSNTIIGGNCNTRLPHNPVTIGAAAKLYSWPCFLCDSRRRCYKTFHAQVRL